MHHDPPPILAVAEEVLAWTLDRTASLPRSQRFTFGQKLDGFMLEIIERIVTARFDPGARTRELRAVNIALEKLRVLWRIVHGRHWISAGQLLFVAARLDEIGRMAGGWMKAEKPRSP